MSTVMLPWTRPNELPAVASVVALANPQNDNGARDGVIPGGGADRVGLAQR